MSLLLESIYLKDGGFRNLSYHQSRMENSVREIYQEEFPKRLVDLFSSRLVPSSGLYKTRVIYDTEIRKVEFVPYQSRPVQSVKLINDSTVSYHHKFLDRSLLEKLFGQRSAADDILIVRNGWITDTCYANVIFKRNDQWFTPESYLLKGTMRQSLLDAGRIKEADINVSNYHDYQSFKLINSMLGMDGPEIPISSIL